MRYIGVDGGGTKTAFTLFDERLADLATVRLPTSHFQQAGLDGMEAVLREGVEALASVADEPVSGIGFGLAGYGRDEATRAAIDERVARVCGDIPHVAVNDGQAALAAALGLRDGIVVVSGTGSIAYALSGGVETRCGGWGYLVGDEGSGWWIGRRVLSEFSRQSDGRSRRGPLHAVVRDELGLQGDYDIVRYAREKLAGDRTRTASLSSLGARAARLGDPGAEAIFADAAAELAALVSTLVDEAFPAGAEEVPVSYVGGVFQAGDLVLSPLSRALPARCRLHAPLHPPAAGPVLVLRSHEQRS